MYRYYHMVPDTYELWLRYIQFFRSASEKVIGIL